MGPGAVALTALHAKPALSSYTNKNLTQQETKIAQINAILLAGNTLYTIALIVLRLNQDHEQILMIW